jgi:hypothetical protein
MDNPVGTAPGQTKSHAIKVSQSGGQDLVLRLEDSFGNKLANAEYSISWDPTGSNISATDGDGILREVAPPGVKGGTIVLSGTVASTPNACPPWTVNVMFVSFTTPTTGIVDPGAPNEARLSNLGFLSSLSRGDALDQYRASKGLSATPPQGMTSANFAESLQNQLIAEHDT